MQYFARFNPFATIRRHLDATAATPTGASADDRIAFYDLCDQYYDNTVYDEQQYGGSRQFINRRLGRDAEAPLAGYYNPISEIVNLYQHVFGGEFGKQITIATANPKLTDPMSTGLLSLSPVEMIYRWTVMDQFKQQVCHLTPLTGNCGIRVVAVDDGPERKRVYMKAEHPRIIRDVDFDARGNLTAILLRYDDITGIGDEQTVRTIEELQTREETVLWEYKNGRRGDVIDRIPNDLGFVSYVLVGFEQSGGDWARNAFYRVLPQLDRLNLLVSHLNTVIHDHVKVMWLVTGGGQAPQKFDFSGLTVMYANTTGGADASATPMVANLNLVAVIEEARELYAQITDKQPELKAILGQFLSNQSGETVKELRKPAEDRLSLARVNIEDGVTRAMQMCLSHGVAMGLWDIGTRTGVDAAERAYTGGYEDFSFVSRPLLPITDDERRTADYTALKLGVDAGVPFELMAREIGKDQEWIDEAVKIKAANRAAIGEVSSGGSNVPIS